MKRYKIMIAFVLMLALMLSFSVPCFASELAGDEVVECNVTIVLSDATGEYPGKSVSVLFEDVTGTAREKVDLKKNNSWGAGAGVIVKLPAPTTYEISFEGLEDGYVVAGASGSGPVASTFSAYEGDVMFNWCIVESDALVDKTVDTMAPSADAAGSLGLSAEDAYKKFLDKVSFIKDDPSWIGSWNSHLNQYGLDSISGDTYSEWYTNYVDGGSAEEYFAMTPFEQFLWTETYTRLANAVGSGNFSSYFDDQGTFNRKVVGIASGLMTGNNNEIVVEAYKELMDWQYDYIITQGHGVPYNFINDRSYIDEVGAAPEEPDKSDSVLTDEEIDDIEEVLDEILEEEDIEVEVEKKGIWDDLMESLAKQSLTILLLIVLLAVLAVFVYRRKSKNIDGE